jgi:pyruvate/2-oxoglutarate dehydrogenase complex dihydrolipoamide acyltransferase (E2) component
MIMKLMQAAVLVAASGLALGGCDFGSTKTAAPAKKPPAADYQAAVPPSPPAAQTRAICYNDADLATVRARMLQQEMSVAALQCQNASGGRAYEPQYASFLQKYQSDLAANARSLQDVARRKRLNVDVLVTEFANRTAQKAPVDKDFCSRSLRALEWALDARTTSITQVPPPYDLGPDMNIHPCSAP